ncbi:SGNH hydrolase-type esterase domain-containing protein [Microdochium trichocladiopsis]|uniref:SGNH hydrolase-type esterase domain-containing protein n=1 Tax=Microdochium trichocladiopsis TaxID=1682393 RepID=A0A9P8Y0N4_9PEZI|nr:SGNH hydrolase-type esterase domain-containing protein [Microdochium trichocladiopsis]KAH7026331.1 SGNH hydrolase-type esterase domain-containing protein [Microdochium trichocladiopsis]
MGSLRSQGQRHTSMAPPPAASSASAKRTPLRILCFGDSLTSGFPTGMPYAVQLRLKLAAAFPHHEIYCEVEGVPGDQVAKGKFIERMNLSWKLAERDKEPYDWTIVLGGTNDLGWGTPISDIKQALEKCWDIALAKGSKVLALTVPETKYNRDKLISQREELNAFIKDTKKRGFFYHDLHSSFPYHSLPPSRKPELWNPDGLHLTSEGYAEVGSKVADELIRLIRLQEATETEISSIFTDARQRRAVEDLIQEEERGDPKLLSQGYIYVRRHDLD